MLILPVDRIIICILFYIVYLWRFFQAFSDQLLRVTFTDTMCRLFVSIPLSHNLPHERHFGMVLTVQQSLSFIICEHTHTHAYINKFMCTAHTLRMRKYVCVCLCLHRCRNLKHQQTINIFILTLEYIYWILLQ